MSLTPFQRRRVAWLKDGHLDDDVDLDDPEFWARRERQVAAISSPEEFFLYASEQHPAMEVDEWRRILSHPLCDYGTALLVFWRNSPVYYYGEDEPAGGWSTGDRERYEMLQEIVGKCETNGYPSAMVRFDPTSFNRFSFLSGYSPAELERVPALMHLPSPGNPVEPLAEADFEWDHDEF